MKTNKSLIAGAALAGILSGGFLSQASAATTTQTSRSVFSAGVLDAEKPAGDTHGCKGQNTCKGKGGCKAGDNGCAGKNTCKGKGGCAMKDGKPAH